MEGITAYVVVLGTHTLIPGFQEFKDTEQGIDCILKPTFPLSITYEKHNIDLSVAESTVFIVQHLNYTRKDLNDASNALAILEKSVSAISETLLWFKGNEKAGKTSRYLRQIGLLDVKYFFLCAGEELIVGWINELNSPQNREAAVAMSNLFPNLINRAAANAHPLPYILRRVLNAIDLINLGFSTEAFISTFALLDDIVQEVVKLGLEKKGLNKDEQKRMLMAIKEERLKHYLTNILKLCDWKSLQDDKKDLFDQLVVVNTLRNRIVHNNHVIRKPKSITSIGVILNVIHWLRQNPFGYQIPIIPSTFIPLKPLSFAKFSDEAANSQKEGDPPIEAG